MAFGDITTVNPAHELKEALGGGRTSKIARSEKDELLIVIKNDKENYRFQISVSVNLPLIYLTDKNKLSLITAPNFCMPLRECIGSAKIVDIDQPGLECIIQFDLEHLDEMGDLYRKKLIVEIMDEYGNTIFCREDDTIIDNIRHVSVRVDSVREALPGRSYFIPQTVAKENPLAVTQETFHQTVGSSSMPVQKALYNHLTSISPVMAGEICHLAGINPDYDASELSEIELLHFYHTFSLMIRDAKEGNFTPAIVSNEGNLVEYVTLSLTCYESGTYHSQSFRSMSCLLEEYYASQNTITRIRQKSPNLRRIVQTSLERNCKKHDLQLKQLKDTEKHEKYRIHGELLNIYGYKLTSGEKSFICLSHCTNEEITIPLDAQLSAKDNVKKHFDKCNKLKRTYEALTDLTKKTKTEIDHLGSISSALDIALTENDLARVKGKLMKYGYIKKRRSSDKRPKTVGKPFHYIPSDGFHIYVGKNNYQSEELTFELAIGDDWWFHAKGIPGSHVIVKAEGRIDFPDRLFEEADSLAAYYPKGRDDNKVGIGYIQKKNVKKATGATSGSVIYHTSYSLVASPGCVLNEVG